MAFDEEIVTILGGKCRGQSHNPDKKGDRGPKCYCLCGKTENLQNESTKEKASYH